MSLINDMLRDLDSRNAATSERNGLDNHVRALPASERRGGIPPLLLALGAAVLGGGAVWLVLQGRLGTTAPEPAPAIAATVAATPPAPLEAPPVVEPVPTALPPEAPVVAPAPELRLETVISAPPAAKAAAPANTPAPAPSTPRLAVEEAPPAKPAPTRAQPLPTNPPPVSEPARSNASAQISKQPSTASTLNEQADAEYRRGVTAFRRGDLNDGAEAMRAALRIQPAHAAARQALLAFLSEQHRWPEVELLALDGVGLSPQRSDWAFLAARLMYERGEASGALTVLDQNAGNARQNTDYQILHALLLQRAGRNADAVDCYQRALAVRPQEGRWWYGLGRALDADHRESLARHAYEKARDTGNLPADLQQAVERRLRQG